MRFFFNDTATTEIYTLSLHDALPILQAGRLLRSLSWPARGEHGQARRLQAAEHSGGLLARRREEPHAHQGLRYSVADGEDRKSTRLNSSHANISYAVFCLKKKTPNY